MSVRLDKVIKCSLFEVFRNYKSPVPSNIVVSGSIPNGGKGFSVVIPYDRPGSIADVYIKKVGNNFKRHASSMWQLPEYVGLTNAYVAVYYSNTDITVEIFVANFGSAYTPTTQTFEVQLVIHDAPIPN